MKLYGGIDRHSNNSVVAITDERDEVLYRKRLPNDLNTILSVLEPYGKQVKDAHKLPIANATMSTADPFRTVHCPQPTDRRQSASASPPGLRHVP